MGDEPMGDLVEEQARRGNGAPPWLDAATIARYTHFERLPQHAMVGLEPELGLLLDAHFVGCPPQQLQAIRDEHARAVTAAAEDLLAEPGFADDLLRAVAVTGPRIVVLGDSITADSLSWANLLAACVTLVSALDGASVVNLAVSGSTTSETIPMFDLVAREEPTAVLAMLGTNDGRRQGSTAGVRTVSAGETRRNLLALQQLTEDEVGARFFAVAPPPMDQQRYLAVTPEASPTRFTTEDLDDTLAVLRGTLPGLIELPDLPDDGQADEFWLPDGLHPTLAGQRALLRRIAYGLARAA
ncbi:acyl-CoA thioesterase-1 [Motilibacter rhizosphaerae]|uniref:Acyl-CoA thioesterase-1 n=1 Tax=Motilibacter rhizosphaerae TaxID=598652 RepID=A0A4Q7NZ11_9ACTN|nr:GDSL-type esterase/lipase family protein [Motilibacter rhizosphaerae]RZS91652.1 acyl-CoA thioesterase-1 [Motilibacter rhizosphaerae]